MPPTPTSSGRRPPSTSRRRRSSTTVSCSMLITAAAAAAVTGGTTVPFCRGASAFAPALSAFSASSSFRRRTLHFLALDRRRARHHGGDRGASVFGLGHFWQHPFPWSSSGSSSALFSSGTATEESSSSSSSSSSSVQGRRQQQRQNRPPPDTGGLRKLPVVRRSNEIVSRARKVAWNVKPDASIKNARNRARKHGAERMDALTKALCIPLRDAVNGYRRELRRLHPFEKVVADLTARAREKKDGLTLSDVLDEIHEARKELLLAGKDWIAAAKGADTARGASDALAEGESRLCDIFAEIAAGPLDGLIELQKSLRTVPAVRLDSPAVVLVGAPNVGKSSIVRAISSATPEVNNYPFTTRGMTLGHVEIFWDRGGAAVTGGGGADAAGGDVGEGAGGVVSDSDDSIVGGTSSYAYSQLCQVMDSPGLLVREDRERNEMEALTLAAMRHLPTAVMYVMDLSGQAGDKCSSVEDQLQLRREVRERFPRRPWIDVVSKVDLGVVDGAIEELESILADEDEKAGHDRKRTYIKLSITEGDGVEELREAVMIMLGEVKLVLDAMAASSDPPHQTSSETGRR